MSGNWQRGVSIIGVGRTAYGNVLERPELKGMTTRELISWAALEALNDAGIEPKDVDSLLVAHFQGETEETQSTEAVAAEWLGLKRKPAVKYETACSSGASGVRLASSLIASGIDDVVLVVGAEILNSVLDSELYEYRKQPAIRKPIDPGLQFDLVARGFDQAYFQPFATDLLAGLSAYPILAYMKKYGLTVKDIDDAQSMAAISLRRNAARNPKAMHRKEYAEIAKEAGYSNVMEYMRSGANPWVSWPIRTCHLYSIADGGSALVLCATEKAKQYNKKPVNVRGVGLATGLPYTDDPLRNPVEQAAIEQAYKMANINPKDIGYVSLHDCMIHQHITVTEMLGYFEPGQAWKAIIDGRTAFDGDKPVNTHGGCPSFGNAYDIAGINEIAEAVLQLKEEAGPCQVNPPPKLAVTHALGAGPSFGVTVLERGF